MKKQTIIVNNQKITLAPRFDGMDIYNLPVEIIRLDDGRMSQEILPNIEAACSLYDMRQFSGAMAGMIGKQYALRFETREAYKALSQ